jgi:hypothetical protein
VNITGKFVIKNSYLVLESNDVNFSHKFHKGTVLHIAANMKDEVFIEIIPPVALP